MLALGFRRQYSRRRCIRAQTTTSCRSSSCFSTWTIAAGPASRLGPVLAGPVALAPRSRARGAARQGAADGAAGAAPARYGRGRGRYCAWSSSDSVMPRWRSATKSELLGDIKVCWQQSGGKEQALCAAQAKCRKMKTEAEQTRKGEFLHQREFAHVSFASIACTSSACTSCATTRARLGSENATDTDTYNKVTLEVVTLSRHEMPSAVQKGLVSLVRDEDVGSVDDNLTRRYDQRGKIAVDSDQSGYGCTGGGHGHQGAGAAHQGGAAAAADGHQTDQLNQNRKHKKRLNSRQAGPQEEAAQESQAAQPGLLLCPFLNSNLNLWNGSFASIDGRTPGTCFWWRWATAR